MEQTDCFCCFGSRSDVFSCWLWLWQCSTQTSNATDKTGQELQQNDYRGGVIRTLTLKDSVLNVMEQMKSNNTAVRETSPNSYWTADGYQDFVSTFWTHQSSQTHSVQ